MENRKMQTAFVRRGRMASFSPVHLTSLFLPLGGFLSGKEGVSMKPLEFLKAQWGNL